MISLEDRIYAVEARNARVSLDKKWETSFTRRLFISLITYACASLIFIYITPTPVWFLAALVPVMGYAVSTLSLPWIRKAWEARTTKNNS